MDVGHSSFCMNSNRNDFRDQQSHTFNSKKGKFCEETRKSATTEELIFPFIQMKAYNFFLIETFPLFLAKRKYDLTLKNF